MPSSKGKNKRKPAKVVPRANTKAMAEKFAAKKASEAPEAPDAVGKALDVALKAPLRDEPYDQNLVQRQRVVPGPVVREGRDRALLDEFTPVVGDTPQDVAYVHPDRPERPIGAPRELFTREQVLRRETPYNRLVGESPSVERGLDQVDKGTSEFMEWLRLNEKYGIKRK